MLLCLVLAVGVTAGRCIGLSSQYASSLMAETSKGFTYKILAVGRNAVSHSVKILCAFYAHLRLPALALFVYRSSGVCQALQSVHTGHYRGMQAWAAANLLSPAPVDAGPAFRCQLPVLLELPPMFHPAGGGAWPQFLCAVSVGFSFVSFIVVWAGALTKVQHMHSQATQFGQGKEKQKLEEDAKKLEERVFKNVVNCSLNILDLTDSAETHGFYFRTLFEVRGACCRTCSLPAQRPSTICNLGQQRAGRAASVTATASPPAYASLSADPGTTCSAAAPTQHRHRQQPGAAGGDWEGRRQDD